MGKQVEFKVVGMTFRTAADGAPFYPANLHRLAEIHEQRQAADVRAGGDGSGVPVPLILIRDPENPADPNAVEVHAPILGRGGAGWVGFVPRDLAAKLAPSMDRGDVWEARLDRVLVMPEHPDRPGASVVIERTVRVPIDPVPA